MGITAVGAPDSPATEAEKQAGEVAALLRERASYVARNLPGRVAQVDAQLKAKGGTPPKG